jgi:hypothetical protein
VSRKSGEAQELGGSRIPTPGNKFVNRLRNLGGRKLLDTLALVDAISTTRTKPSEEVDAFLVLARDAVEARVFDIALSSCHAKTKPLKVRPAQFLETKTLFGRDDGRGGLAGGRRV